MAVPTKRRRLAGGVIAAVFLFALFMGAGPGLQIANRPERIELGFGLALPSLYAWGLLWYAVEATCLVLAYFLVWRDSGER